MARLEPVRGTPEVVEYVGVDGYGGDSVATEVEAEG